MVLPSLGQVTQGYRPNGTQGIKAAIHHDRIQAGIDTLPPVPMAMAMQDYSNSSALFLGDLGWVVAAEDRSAIDRESTAAHHQVEAGLEHVCA